MAPHGSSQVLERCNIVVDHPPPGVLGPAGALPALVAEHFIRIGRQEGIPGPALTSLERFQQESVRAAVELRESGDRRVAIQYDLSRNGDHTPSARPLAEKVEPRAH